MDIPIPIETMKKWFDYWRKFKGKRVQIYLRSGINIDYQLANPLKPLNLGGDTTINMNFSDNLIGTVTDIVESPFGILLKDVCIASEKTELIEKTFIPMSEITRIHIFKKETGKEIYVTEKPKSSDAKT